MAIDDFDQFVDDVVSNPEAPAQNSNNQSGKDEEAEAQNIQPPLLTTDTLVSTRYRVATTLPMVRSRRIVGSSSWRGTPEAIEEAFASKEAEVLQDIQEQAQRAGANAVVKVHFQCGEISAAGKPLFYMAAQGTPVIVKDVSGTS